MNSVYDSNSQYLGLLSKQYPSIQTASLEIVNLSAQLHLPKETEHFLSDIHGEHEAFLHVLKNSSGAIHRRIDELFNQEMTTRERATLATLVYYPDRKLSLMLNGVENKEEFYTIVLRRLIRLCRSIASKYTQSDLRAAYPAKFAETINEMLLEQEHLIDRQEYYAQIINMLVEVGQADEIIIALARLIQRLSIGHLHIIGDIFDRGPGAHIILDTLMDYHSLDFQWGNHDIVWMGAAAGSEACIANVLRVSLRYANTETLENGYGISLLPLASFAMDVYRDDPCEQFMPSSTDDMVQAEALDENEQRLLARMQKAITIIQFKLEGQIIQRRLHYRMEDRLLLDKIDFEQRVVRIGNQSYELLDSYFPTVDPKNPYELNSREKVVMERIKFSFQQSEILQRHVHFLFAKGSMYLVYNGNLLYHGCINMKADGSFGELVLDGQSYHGKSYLDRVERLTRQGYFAEDPQKRQYGQDAMWYLWCGARSPLFGKAKMATFERYFVKDLETHIEPRNPYFDLRNDENVIHKILVEFGLNSDSARIINGHVPVKVSRGESPLKANGKLLVIDGGFAKAYQKTTGIAGYTLIYNSYGLLLAEHKPFESTWKVIEEEKDMDTITSILGKSDARILIKDTDRGRAMQDQIQALQALVSAYRSGLIKEQS